MTVVPKKLQEQLTSELKILAGLFEQRNRLNSQTQVKAIVDNSRDLYPRLQELRKLLVQFKQIIEDFHNNNKREFLSHHKIREMSEKNNGEGIARLQKGVDHFHESTPEIIEGLEKLDVIFQELLQDIGVGSIFGDRLQTITRQIRREANSTDIQTFEIRISMLFLSMTSVLIGNSNDLQHLVRTHAPELLQSPYNTFKSTNSKFEPILNVIAGCIAFLKAFNENTNTTNWQDRLTSDIVSNIILNPKMEPYTGYNWLRQNPPTIFIIKDTKVPQEYITAAKEGVESLLQDLNLNIRVICPKTGTEIDNMIEDSVREKKGGYSDATDYHFGKSNQYDIDNNIIPHCEIVLLSRPTTDVANSGAIWGASNQQNGMLITTKGKNLEHVKIVTKHELGHVFGMASDQTKDDGRNCTD